MANNKLAMLDDLSKMRQNRGEDVASWFGRIRAAVGALLLVGEPTTQSAQKMIAIRGMQPGYDVEQRIQRQAAGVSLSDVEAAMSVREKDILRDSKAAADKAAAEGVPAFGAFQQGGGRGSQAGAGGHGDQGWSSGRRGGRAPSSRGARYGGGSRSSFGQRNAGGGRGSAAAGTARPKEPPGGFASNQCFVCWGFDHRAADCANNKKGLLAGVQSLLGSDEFFLDSCAGCNGTPRRDILRDFVPEDKLSPEEKSGNGMITAGGVVLQPKGKGRMDLLLESGHPIQFKDVYFYPELKFNLISFGLFMKMPGMSSRGDGEGMAFFRNKSKILHGTWNGNVLRTVAEALPGDLGQWNMGGSSLPPSSADVVLGLVTPIKAAAEQLADQQPEGLSAAKEKLVEEAWRTHEMLGHPNHRALSTAVAKGIIEGVDQKLAPVIKDLPPCDACIRGKLTRPPFPVSSRAGTWLAGQLLSMDLHGKTRVASGVGKRYFLAVKDAGFSHSCLVEGLRHKSEATDKAIVCINYFERQSGNKVKVIRFDRGELATEEMKLYCKNRGIKMETTTAHTSQQNGSVEKFNRDIVETIRTQLIQAKLPPSFWGYALEISNYQKNRSPHSSNPGQKSPMEMLTGRPPDVSHMQPFGTTAYVKLLPPHTLGAGKLDAVSVAGRLLGYSRTSKAYIIWLGSEGSRILGGREILETRDVHFPGKRVHGAEEQDIDQQQEAAGLDLGEGGPETPDASEDPPDVGSEELGIDELPAGEEDARPAAPQQTQQPRHGTRIRTAPVRYGLAAISQRAPDPVTLEDILNSPDSAIWLDSNKSEFQSIKDNGVIEAVGGISDLPPGTHVLDAKFIMKTKLLANGKLDKHKSRCCVRGDKQRPWEYTEIAAPVGKMSSLRISIGMAAKLGKHIRQFDVKSAFLQAPLKEDVYIRFPPGWIDEMADDQVFRLHKALYGLKQAPLAWYNWLRDGLEGIEVLPSEADTALFIKRSGKSGEDNVIIFCVVDDRYIIGDPDPSAVVIDKIKELFPVEERPGDSFLGMEVTSDWDRGTITLSQRGYTADMLSTFGMSDCRPFNTPAEEKLKLNSTDGEPLSPEDRAKYMSMFGKMNYLSTCTRPDISQSVGVLGRFMAAPTTVHMKAAVHLMRYISGTRDFGLCYGANQQEGVVIYSDADWAGCHDSRRSTTGYVVLLNGTAVSWCSKLQPTVATSTVEAEYMAASAAVREALWLREIFKDMGFPLDGPLDIRSDNQGAISLSANPMVTRRTKHIDVQHHVVRERVKRKEVTLSYVPTGLMVADVLTKAVGVAKVQSCRSMMGLIGSGH